MFIVGSSLPITACSAGNKGKGAAQEGGHTAPGAQMKHKGPHTRRKQGHTDIQAGQDRHQDGGAGHGERVLQAQQQHFPCAYLGILLGAREKSLVDFGKYRHSHPPPFFPAHTGNTRNTPSRMYYKKFTIPCKLLSRQKPTFPVKKFPVKSALFLCILPLSFFRQMCYGYIEFPYAAAIPPFSRGIAPVMKPERTLTSI